MNKNFASYKHRTQMQSSNQNTFFWNGGERKRKWEVTCNGNEVCFGDDEQVLGLNSDVGCTILENIKRMNCTLWKDESYGMLLTSQ